MIDIIEYIVKNSFKDEDFQEIYYSTNKNKLSYSDKVGCSVQSFMEQECNPIQPDYDMTLEQLDRLLSQEDQSWTEHIKATQLDLYIQILAEISFSIECALDNYAGDE